MAADRVIAIAAVVGLFLTSWSLWQTRRALKAADETAAATRDLADAETERRTEERVRAATAEWRCTSTPINGSPRTWDIDLRNVGQGDAELLSIQPGFARDDLDALDDEQWTLRGAQLPRPVRAGESAYVHLRGHQGKIITSLTMAVRWSDGREGQHTRVLPVDEGDFRS